MTNSETKGRTALGVLEPVVFALRTKWGEAVVAAVGHKALASVYPFACEIETVAHFQELGGLERRAWPPAGEGVALGLVIADLDLLLQRPQTALEAPPGWVWMLVTDERRVLHGDDGRRDFLGFGLLLCHRLRSLQAGWCPVRRARHLGDLPSRARRRTPGGPSCPRTA
ncbi:MAG TPA: hypothetical protein VM285_09605, partial [Polyangia bacterium]|nr:hypothetical protein [Polyangia bacterium]